MARSPHSWLDCPAFWRILLAGTLVGLLPLMATPAKLTLAQSNQVWAWGDNAFGDLGNGNNIPSGTPVQVDDFTDVRAIAAGYLHSLLVTANGDAWAWGWNESGQLGNGTTAASYVPVQVSGLAGVSAVAAGNSHSLALLEDGTVWSWGDNEQGQLGAGSNTLSTVPLQINNLSGIVAIAAGGDRSLALRNDGTVWQWGFTSPCTAPCSPTIPTQVSDLSGIIAIATSPYHSLALKNDGTVWAWGSDDLGNPATSESATPVQVIGLTNVIAIATDPTAELGHPDHDLALEKDGSVWTWGQSACGPSGCSATPVQVTGLGDVTAIAAGDSHSLALASDGTVWAWGDNTFGQLGPISIPSSVTPVQVSGLAGVSLIAAGAFHNLAVSGAVSPPPPPGGQVYVTITQIVDRFGVVYDASRPYADNHTVDGNVLTATVQVAVQANGNGNNSWLGNVAINDSVLGQPLGVTDVPVAVDPLTPTVTATLAFTTDGLAWGTEGHPIGARNLTASFRGTFSSSPVTITIDPRPVVMVHGLNADYTTWQAWYEPGGFLQKAGYPASAFTPGASQGEHYGYPVNTMDTESKPCPLHCTMTTAENAQALGQYIDQVRQAAKAEKVDLVAHSMGGLIARYYISNTMPGRVVARLIMLGTPNMGSAAAVAGVGGNVIFPEPATFQNTPDYVQHATNMVATNRHGAHFFAIGGDLLPPCPSLDWYPSDVVVNHNSTRTLSIDAPVYVGTAPLSDQEYQDMAVDHTTVPYVPGNVPLCLLATDGEETSSQAVFDTVFGKMLGNPDMAMANATPDASQQAASTAATSAPSVEAMTPIMAVQDATLAPGQSVTLTTTASKLSDLMALVRVNESPTDTRPVLTLTSPSGAVSTGPSPQPGVQFEDASAGGEYPFLAFSTQNPQDGQWLLTVTNPLTSNQASLLVEAQFRTTSTTGLALSAQTDQASYASGQTIMLTATLLQINGDGSSQAIGASSGGAVTATVASVVDPSLTPQTLTLYDDGAHGDGAANDGIYGAAFSAPGEPGDYAVQVLGAGAGSQRVTEAAFTVASTTPVTPTPTSTVPPTSTAALPTPTATGSAPLPPVGSPTSTPAGPAPSTATNTPGPAAPTQAATPAGLPAQPTATSVIAGGCTVHTAPPLAIRVAQHSVVSGSMLALHAASAPHMRVSIALQVTTTKVTDLGKGKHRKRVKHTVVLYRITRQGTTNAHGQFDGKLKVTYKPNKAARAGITVTAQTVCAAVTRSSQVMITPPRSLPLAFGLSRRSVTSGAMLPISVHSEAGAHVNVTLQVTRIETVTGGAGKHHKRITRAVVLYRIAHQGSADTHGFFTTRLHITYRPARAVQATLTVAVHAPRGAAARSSFVTILPQHKAKPRR